ncbi:hypothetical protein [Pseudomonas syringae]|uniref:hypothetical protein n=1 Tax=Pseudomonas syringae TaxID=317 RepID=UPI000EFDEADD|nr:hypothetical protein [Pseudomonas syringae]
MNAYLLSDLSWTGPLVIAIQRAILDEFTSSDWHEIVHLTGLHSYITGHKRLLRSLDWGDNDYGDCVFDVLGRLQRYNPEALTVLIENSKILPLLEVSVPKIIHDLGLALAMFGPLHLRKLLLRS